MMIVDLVVVVAVAQSRCSFLRSSQFVVGGKVAGEFVGKIVVVVAPIALTLPPLLFHPRIHSIGMMMNGAAGIVGFSTLYRPNDRSMQRSMQLMAGLLLWVMMMRMGGGNLLKIGKVKRLNM